MMRKVLICLLLVLALTISVSAATQYVNDGENLLSDREEQQLSQTLHQLSGEYEIEIIVVTAAGFDGKSVEEYAEDSWEKRSNGKDGILFLFSMTQRKYDIYYTGRGMSIFDNKALDKIEEAIVAQLRAEDPYGAANAFVDTTRGILENYAKEQASWAWKTPLICLGVGAVIGLIVVLVLASQHKNVRRKVQAGDYVKPGSFQLTQCLDLYLYQTTTRRRKPQNSGGSGRASGGGGSHRSGSF